MLDISQANALAARLGAQEEQLAQAKTSLRSYQTALERSWEGADANLVLSAIAGLSSQLSSAQSEIRRLSTAIRAAAQQVHAEQETAERERLQRETEERARREAEARQALEDVAWRVIRGEFGNGNDRVRRLTAAGYDYNAVQQMVDEMKRQGKW